MLHAPEDLLNQDSIDTMQRNMLERWKDLGLEDLDLNVSVIPNRVYRFNIDPPAPSQSVDR